MRIDVGLLTTMIMHIIGRLYSIQGEKEREEKEAAEQNETGLPRLSALNKPRKTAPKTRNCKTN